MVSLLAIILAKLTCSSIPAEYASVIMVSDEHEASYEFSLGNKWAFGLKTNNDYDEEGLRDPDIYTKILGSSEFFDSLARVRLGDYHNITYADYLKRYHHSAPWIEKFEGERDDSWAKDIIKDNILYKADHDFMTFKVQFKDNDPKVAQGMAEASIGILNNWLNSYDAKKYERRYAHAKKLYEEAHAKYEKLREQYVKMAGADVDVEEKTVLAEIENMAKEVDKAKSFAREKYVKMKRSEYIKNQPRPVFSVLSPASKPTSPCSPVFLGYAIAYMFVALVLVKWVKMFLKTRKTEWQFDFGDLSSPWFLSLLIWVVVLIGTMSVGDMLYPIGNQFWYAILCWLPILLFSSLITYTLLTPRQSIRAHKLSGFDMNAALFNFFLCLTLFMTPLHLYKMWQQIAALDPVHMLYNIRTLAVSGDRGVYGILNYASWINKALFIVALWQYPKISKWKIAAIVVLNFMSSFASMEKSGLCLMVIMSLFVMFSRGAIKIRTILYILLGLVGLLYIINVTILTSADEESEHELFEFIGAYILTPPIAFCYLTPEFETQFGMHTLMPIYRILNHFGFDFELQTIVGEFVDVPIMTNVYTIMDPFFVDFGYKGVAFFAFVYGVALGWAYSLFRKGLAFGKCLYTFCMFFIIMQYYMEEFFIGIYLNLFLIFILYIITQERYRFRPE